MREAVIQAVNILQDHLLLRIIRTALGRGRSYRVFAVREVQDVCTVVAILAKALAVAGLATHIDRANAGKEPVFFAEVSNLVITRKKGREVRVARFADVRRLLVIVTGVARCHRRKIRRARVLHCL